MGGHTVPTVFAGLPLDLVPMYFELDGTFPNHEANPLDPKNLVDLQERVREEGADLGLAFDGDADRCFVVDERGDPVSPSAITALVAARELARNGGSGTVIHNLITSWSVPEVVRETRRHTRPHPRRPLLHQGRDGRAPARSSAASTPRTTTSATSGTPTRACSPPSTSSPRSAARTARCPPSSPSTTATPAPARSTPRWTTRRTAWPRSGRRTRAARASTLDELDGLTVTATDWWFNLRPSNTEPLLRLNVEARDEETMTKVRDEVLASSEADPARIFSPSGV